MIIKVVLFFRFGHQGASLFSKPNPKMAVKGTIRGQNGMKLGTNDPWLYLQGPYSLDLNLATRGPSLFSNREPEIPVSGL